MTADVLGSSRTVFRAVMRAVVPSARELGEAQWLEAEGLVNGLLAGRPPAMQRQLRTFLRILEHGARLRYGRPLSQLAPGPAARYLRAFEHSPVPLLRRGFWGVRTLALMGFYARSDGAAQVGYRASAQGWAAREVAG